MENEDASDESDKDEFDPTNVFIQNLPKSVNDDTLYTLCSQYGKVESVKIMVCNS